MSAWYVLRSSKLDGKALWWPRFQEADRQNRLQQNVRKFHLNTSASYVETFLNWWNNAVVKFHSTIEFSSRRLINWLQNSKYRPTDPIVYCQSNHANICSRNSAVLFRHGSWPEKKLIKGGSIIPSSPTYRTDHTDSDHFMFSLSSTLDLFAWHQSNLALNRFLNALKIFAYHIVSYWMTLTFFRLESIIVFDYQKQADEC